MAATFGGYGLPLNGALPAALAGGPAYSLEEANTRPPDASSDAVVTALALTAKPPAEEVLIEAGLVKARARGQEGAAGALHARRAGCVRAHLRCALMPPRARARAQAIGGRTWCGVEYGTAPGYAHSYFEARARGGMRGR
jgi:hypothetical protein